MDQEQETYVNVLLVLDSRRRVLVGEAELLLHAAALEELQTGDPLRAGMFGWVERLLVEIRIIHDSNRAHPHPTLDERKTKAGKLAKPQKPSTPGLAKVKHVYGPSGSCMVDHDGNGPCGKCRERKPRAGAAVAAAAVEDERTLAIPGTEGGVA